METTMQNSPAHIAAAKLLAIDTYYGMADVGTEWEINFIISQHEQWIERHEPRTASQLAKITEIYNQCINKYEDEGMDDYLSFMDDSKLDFITGEHRTI